MKFPEYSDQLPSELASYRQPFGKLAGALDSDPVFCLVAFLAVNIARLASESVQQTIVVSIAGAQGTGKSTMSRLLASMLHDCFNTSTTILSLDDFYLPLEYRQRVAADIHPLLGVRGVPGTHDLVLMEKVLTDLLQGRSVEVPVFNKGEDDRNSQWLEAEPATVILCEGWCWGAVPEPQERLMHPINDLERTQDPDGLWRRYVNEQLSQYQSVFQASAQIFFRAPSVEAIVRWRFQQEQELANRGGGSKVMSEMEVRQFVAYYERITGWMLEEMTGRASVVVSLDEGHSIQDVRVN
ncbi:MAG: kinase [Gammaproteobacteria bacterium]|nr:kinase [Gammaproteobacteria bacterium]